MGLPKSGENSTFNYLINLINLLFDFLINDIKIYRVKVIWAKDGDSWTTQGWEINFFGQNIGMFEWLFTQTYIDIWPCCCEKILSYHICSLVILYPGLYSGIILIFFFLSHHWHLIFQEIFSTSKRSPTRTLKGGYRKIFLFFHRSRWT